MLHIDQIGGNNLKTKVTKSWCNVRSKEENVKNLNTKAKEVTENNA